MSDSTSKTQGKAQDAGNLQREIQQQQDSKDAAKAQGGSEQKAEQAVQAGTHEFPATPLPDQHLEKPGIEADMELRPQFLAPGYKGSGKLEGLSAIVTGGDSGIGRAVAVLYAREGADVALVYLPDEQTDGEETRRHIEAEGRRCLLIPGDVRSMDFCRRAVEDTVAEFGKLDILVNNAAFQEHADSLEDLTEERFDLTMKTNIYGYFHMAKAALPHLKKGASIINTGSVVGLQGSAKLLDYSATKGAIHAFTMSLASKPRWTWSRSSWPNTTRAAASSKARSPSSPGPTPASAARLPCCSRAKAPTWRCCTWTKPRMPRSPASMWKPKAPAAW